MLPKNLQAATIVVAILLGSSALASGNAITNGEVENLWGRVDWKKEINSHDPGDDTWSIRKGHVPRRFLADETEAEFYRPVVEECATVLKFDLLVKGNDAPDVAEYVRKLFTSEANIDKSQVQVKSREQKDKRGRDIPDAKCARRFNKETTRITFVVTTTDVQATATAEEVLSTMKKSDVLTSKLRSQGGLRICGATVSKANTKHVCQKKDEESSEEESSEEAESEEEEQEEEDFERRAFLWLQSILASYAP